MLFLKYSKDLIWPSISYSKSQIFSSETSSFYVTRWLFYLVIMITGPEVLAGPCSVIIKQFPFHICVCEFCLLQKVISAVSWKKWRCQCSPEFAGDLVLSQDPTCPTLLLLQHSSIFHCSNILTVSGSKLSNWKWAHHSELVVHIRVLFYQIWKVKYILVLKKLLEIKSRRLPY